MKEVIYEAFMTTIEEMVEEKVREKLRELELKMKEEEKAGQIINPDQYLSIQQLSELTGLCKATIYAMRSKREIPAYKFGRELRFKRGEIDQWIASRRQVTLNIKKDTNSSKNPKNQSSWL